MMAFVRILTFLLLAIAATAAPARASFGDCNSATYLRQFDSRFGADFLCVESDRVPVTSDAGTTHIRIVQHLVADWATRPGAMRSIKDGVAASVRAMGRLGHFRISDVTILLVDGFGPGVGSETFGEAAAWTSFDAGDECRITVWLLGPGATAGNGGSAVSHELFHCVERSTLTRAQLTSGAAPGAAGGGTWWIEGAADWFSTLALPAADYMRDRVSEFDAHSDTRALNEMTYDAYVFFAWLGTPPARVMPFLNQMASSAGVAAQRTAMIAALSAGDWLKFAEDYVDGKIRDGHGASVGSTPREGQTYEWTDTATKNVSLHQFVLARGNLNVRCGRWGMRPTPATFHGARPTAAGSAWSAIPATIEAMDGAEHRYRFAGMAASATPVTLRVAGTRQARCEECQGTREVDRCLVGTWRMTADGAARWMRENIHKANVTGISQEGNTLTLNPDGTFATGASRVKVTLEGSGGTKGKGTLNGQASGRWSAAGGHLNLCPDASAASGTITVVTNGRTITIPNPARAAPSSSQAYACGASQLTVTTPMPRGTTVETTYVKESPTP